MHDRIDPGALVEFLLDLDVVRKQPHDVRIGADRLRQAGAERRVDHALLDQIAHRLVRVVLLDRDRLEQRQHGRAAVRAAGVHRALHPVDLAQVDAVFVLQEAVDVDRRRHGEERHADALAFEVLRLGDAGLLVDGDEAVAEGARRKHRDGDERALLVGEALHELGAGIFRDVEFLARPTCGRRSGAAGRWR